MKVARAVIKGLTRMAECSGLVVAMWLIVLTAALPFAAVMEDAIRTDVGSSLIHEDLRQGLDLGWLEEFRDRRGGLADTLRPVRVSPAMPFETLELWLNGGWVSDNRVLAAAGGLFLVVWILVQGGILTHLSSPELRFGWSTFLAAGSTYFFRFLRLALMMGVAYYGVYRLAYWMFPAIETWTRDITSEKTALGLHLVGLVVVATLMAIVHLVAEFARIATVREKRRSMLLAVVRSGRQVGRHPLQSAGVFGVMLLMLGSVQVLYYWTAPAVGGAGPWALLIAFGIGQVYLLIRWALRIARYGAEIALFDSWTRPALSPGRDPTDI